MIEIKVKLFGHLRNYLLKEKQSTAHIEIDAGSTIQDLFEKLDIPEDEVKLVYVNHRRVSEEYVLESGDQVGIFPPIAGGKGA